MKSFLRFMICVWFGAITVSILTESYATAILGLVFLISTISDLWYEIKHEKIMKDIEKEKEFIERLSKILKESK